MYLLYNMQTVIQQAYCSIYCLLDYGLNVQSSWFRLCLLSYIQYFFARGSVSKILENSAEMVITDTENLPVVLATVLSVLVLLPVVYYVYLAAAFVNKKKKIGRGVNQLPGPPTHWLLGNMHQVWSSKYHPPTLDDPIILTVMNLYLVSRAVRSRHDFFSGAKLGRRRYSFLDCSNKPV